MTAPDLALQTAIRSRLIATPEVTALVAADHIRDGDMRSESLPSIIFGNAQTVLEGVSYGTRSTRVFLDLHVWTSEGGSEQAKTIAGAVWNALMTAPEVPGFALLGNFWVTGSRALRDPKDYGHVVVSVEALMAEQL